MELNRPDVWAVGWGHTPFGKLTGSLEDLIVSATQDALASSGALGSDIDEIFLGNFNSGMNPLGFPSGLIAQADDDLRLTQATRVENACASGSAAVHQAVRSLWAGTANTVLVVGAEKMTASAPHEVGRALLGADYDLAGEDSPVGFAEVFAEVAVAYGERYGDVSDVLATIAAKNHRNGLDNPWAHLRKDLGVEFCSTVSAANPLVAPPLRRTDCSPVSDGAAALVLTRADSPLAERAAAPVRIRGIGQAGDFLPRSKRDPLEFAGAQAAWQRCMADAAVMVDDLHFLEVHDCFTIAELMLYEVLGVAQRGRGRLVLEEGTVYAGGRLPVNRSGGLKAKGHPVGATGVSQHVMAVLQLSGAAGLMQLSEPSLGGVFNMGGMAVANYATILEKVS